VIERCQHPDTTTTGHGNPDRQPVRCLAFDLAHLPVIATRHRSTLAPSSLRGRLHRSRGRKPDRTAGDRALPARTTPAATLAHVCNRCLQAPRDPAHATATPIGTRYAVSPSTWHHLPAIATRHRSTLAPSSLRGRLHRSRGRRPDRTAGDRALPARTTPAATLAHVCNRCLQAPREPDQATARPIGSRCAVPRSTWHRLPAIATRRRRRFVAGFTNREDEGPTELPAIEHCQQPDILPTPRQPRSAAGTLSRLRPGTICRRSPPGTARHWRRRRFVAGFTDRENEGPAELPVIEHCQHGPRQRQPWRTSATDACKQPEILTTPRQPRSAAGTLSRLALAHLPAIATRHRSMLAPSSLRGRLHRSRERRPCRTAGDRALPARATPAATLAHVCNRCLQALRDPD
jgi:hypothetical protein